MSGINYDLQNIHAMIFDVDGVLSPSVVPTGEDGKPVRMCNVKDGYALQLAVKTGMEIAIITGGDGKNIIKRYNLLGIKDVFIGVSDKLPVLKQWLSEKNINPEQALYMGDDIPDLRCMRYVGLPSAPTDAAWEAKETALYVSRFCGGYGCVRDVIEQVLRAQGKWNVSDNLLNSW